MVRLYVPILLRMVRRMGSILGSSSPLLSSSSGSPRRPLAGRQTPDRVGTSIHKPGFDKRRHRNQQQSIQVWVCNSKQSINKHRSHQRTNKSDPRKFSTSQSCSEQRYSSCRQTFSNGKDSCKHCEQSQKAFSQRHQTVCIDFRRQKHNIQIQHKYRQIKRRHIIPEQQFF